MWPDSGIKLILCIQHSASVGSFLTSKSVDSRISLQRTGPSIWYWLTQCMKESLMEKTDVTVFLWKKEVYKVFTYISKLAKTSTFLPYILHKNRSVDFSFDLWSIILEIRVSHDIINLLKSVVVLPILRIPVPSEA